jgi:uncharacterized protein (DUF2147 family)
VTTRRKSANPRPLAWLAAASALAAAAAPAQAQAAHPVAPAITGDWLVPPGSEIVRIGPCAGRADLLCGAISWLKRPNTKQGLPKTDVSNPDPALRARPLIGLTILQGFRPEPGGRYRGRFNSSGKTIDAWINVREDGTLNFKGCVLMVCGEQIWTRPSSSPTAGA